MNERFLKVLHDIIDGLGGGHQHLHAAVDEAATTPVTEDAPTPGADENPEDGSNADQA